MSGGVRNLRAMFESKDVSTSPPDRGRTPAGPTGLFLTAKAGETFAESDRFW